MYMESLKQLQEDKGQYKDKFPEILKYIVSETHLRRGVQ
jgi:hypothetical protein